MITPPNAHPAIGASTEVRLSIRDQLKLLGVVIALTAAAMTWMNAQDRRAARLEEGQAVLVKQVAAIMDALGVRQPVAVAPMYGPPRTGP